MNLTEKKHQLFIEIAHVVQEARKLAYRSNNSILLGMNWQIGKLIVEDEQGGNHK